MYSSQLYTVSNCTVYTPPEHIRTIHCCKSRKVNHLYKGMTRHIVLISGECGGNFVNITPTEHLVRHES